MPWAPYSWAPRKIVAGDVLTREQAQQLTFVPITGAEGDADIAGMSITPDGLASEVQMTLRIGSGKNKAPTAQDSEFETYKNIAAPVPLSVQDPENEPLTVTIVSEPKRGTVDVAEDGTVTYTPNKEQSRQGQLYLYRHRPGGQRVGGSHGAHPDSEALGQGDLSGHGRRSR